jgi:hypothetical protein
MVAAVEILPNDGTQGYQDVCKISHATIDQGELNHLTADKEEIAIVD